MNLEKTKVMCVGDLHVVVDGKTITQANRCLYLDGTACEDERNNATTQRRMEVDTAAWKRVEGLYGTKNETNN